MATTTVTIKRGSGKPANASLKPGELAYDLTANDLYIGEDTTNTGDMVSPARQVELAGTQTITGTKTINVANLVLPSNAAGVGQVLTGTDTAGTCDWSPAVSITVTSVTTNDNNTATPEAAWNAQGITVAAGELVIYTWSGTAYIYGGLPGTDVQCPPGTLTPLGSATTFATQTEVNTGTSSSVAMAPDTYTGNRNITLGDLTTLSTTDKSTAVAAINENFAAIAAIAGNPIFVSALAFNAPIPDGTYTAGQYFIIDSTGTRTEYPAGEYAGGDWLICDGAGTISSGAPGTASFVKLSYSISNQTATLTTFDDTAVSYTAVNVQQALDAEDLLVTANGAAITANGVLITANTAAITGIIGDSTNGSTVQLIDGGTY